jgi:two-component system sensor histidine kinase CpxA
MTSDGTVWLSEGGPAGDYRALVADSFASGGVELDTSQRETALAAKPMTFRDGRSFALIVRWERPRPVAMFGESYLRYLRLGILLLTALLVCYALARYLSSPIEKIRRATQKLAGGELQTRVADKIGRRHDELAELSRDFDMMAERIESLITSQQRLSRDISHELRSPLARMNVALGIAKQKAGHEAAAQLERIETESDRLNEMIGRILTLSKLESRSAEIKTHSIDLREIVETVVDDADFEARPLKKSVALSTDGECVVRGNEELLRSAIENVLRNAVRYTHPETEVEVSLAKEGSDAVIRVQDHGGGVPDNELKNLFRPFYRVGEARDRATGGIGLGLAIAERAIAAHSGTITAVNKNGGLEIEIRINCSEE